MSERYKLLGHELFEDKRDSLIPWSENQRKVLIAAEPLLVYPPNEGGISHPDQRGLDAHLVYIALKWAKVRKTNPDAQFQFKNSGRPGTGKTWGIENIGKGFFSDFMHADPWDVTTNFFDGNARNLRRIDNDRILTPQRQRIIETPLGFPHTDHEFVWTRMHTINHGVDELKSNQHCHLWDMPAGTAINIAPPQAAKPEFEVARSLTDKITYEYILYLSLHHRELLKNLNIYEVSYLGGPWMEVLAWYRQGMKDAKSMSEANEIRHMFGLPLFTNIQDLQKSQVGGSIRQVENSYKQFRKTSYRAWQMYGIPDTFAPPIADSLMIASELTGLDLGRMKQRSILNLALYHVYNTNAAAINMIPDLPESFSFYHSIVLNNPRQFIPEGSWDNVQKFISRKKAEMKFEYTT